MKVTNRRLKRQQGTCRKTGRKTWLEPAGKRRELKDGTKSLCSSHATVAAGLLSWFFSFDAVSDCQPRLFDLSCVSPQWRSLQHYFHSEVPKYSWKIEYSNAEIAIPKAVLLQKWSVL